MKILVFSDSHNRTTKMYDIIDRNKGDTDLVIHLGDHYRDIDDISRRFPTVAFLGVCGNCDFIPNDRYPVSHRVNLEGHVIFMTHGHMQAVKSHGRSLLVAEAKKAGAGIALYGHTHIPLCEKHGDITVFNPGSISEPRGFNGYTYGKIILSGEKAEFEILKYEVT